MHSKGNLLLWTPDSRYPVCFFNSCIFLSRGEFFQNCYSKSIKKIHTKENFWYNSSMHTKNEEEASSSRRKIRSFASKKDDVLILTGELGGVNNLYKGLAKGLDIRQMIKSPTYTIVRDTKGVCHFTTWMSTVSKVMLILLTWMSFSSVVV